MFSHRKSASAATGAGHRPHAVSGVPGPGRHGFLPQVGSLSVVNISSVLLATR